MRKVRTWCFLGMAVGALTGVGAHDTHEKRSHVSNAPEASAALESRRAMRETLSDEAITKWTQRASANPKQPDAWVNLGNALMQKSRERASSALCDRAEAAFRSALTLKTNLAPALVGLAWVYNTRHDFDLGDRFARQALAIDPGLQDAYALLGDAAVELGDYDQAFDLYQQALDLRPDLSSYSRSAHLLWLTGDVSKARWLLQKAIDAGGPHAENSAWCLAELALMTFRNGALLAADQEAELALKGAPSNHHVLAVAGRIKMARKDYDAADQLYRRSIAITPSHDALVGLVDLALLKAKPEEAARQSERVIEFHTSGMTHSHGGITHTHSHAHGNAQLARFYADHNRDLDQALEHAMAAYQEFPNVVVTDTLAWCQYKKGRFSEAARTCRKALKWNTPDAEIHFHAGMIYAALGNRPLAQKHLFHALSLNPQFHPILAPTAAQTLNTLNHESPR